MKRLLVWLFVGGMSTGAIAADPVWIPISKSGDGAIWYVDVLGIKEVEEGYGSQTVRRTWIKIDYSKVASNPAREAKPLAFFKCNDEQFKYTTFIMYKADGSVQRNLSASYGVYKPVIPETNISQMMSAVCKMDLTTPA